MSFSGNIDSDRPSKEVLGGGPVSRVPSRPAPRLQLPPRPQPGDHSAPTAPKMAADPDWLLEVVAREQQQAVWTKDEMAHWKAAVAASTEIPVTGGFAVAPPRDAAANASDELAALMLGRLDLPALQRLNRPPGLVIFCSSTVRYRRRSGHYRGMSMSACARRESS